MAEKACMGIGLLGLGNVGRGTARILLENATQLTQRSGCALELRRVAVRDLDKDRGITLAEGVLTNDPQAVVSDETVDIVVETIGGTDPALQLVRTALEGGKHVVTSNKELIARHGSELLEVARAKGVNLFYEAAVAGAIPIVHGLKNCLAANNLSKVVGIMNGTTNFILTKMYKEGADFDDVLREAQELGFAEADPTDDVDGFDVAYKLAILASIAFNTHFRFEDVYFEGIRTISAEDIAQARKLGMVIKLLALAEARGEDVELRVHPVMVDEWHPLAGVNDSFNAVFVQCSYADEAMFYGRGAGEFPTASAVVGDVMDIAMHRCMGQSHPSMSTNFCKKRVVPMGEVVSEYYLRLSVADEPGVLSQIAGVCGQSGVSIKSVEQKEPVESRADLVLVTHAVRESAMQEAAKALRDLSGVHALENLIRVGV